MAQFGALIMLKSVFIFYFLLIVKIGCNNVTNSVFSTTNSYLDLSRKFSFESFIHWSGNEEPNSDIKTLKLSLQIHTLANSSAADNQDFYHMAACKLKKLLPSLERIELNGGHCYFPQTQDNSQFKSELSFLAYSIESIWKAFRYVDVKVRPLNYKLALVFNNESLKDTNIEESLQKAFGQESTVRSSSNNTHFTVLNDKHNNYLDIQLYILTDLEAIRQNTTLPHGRTKFTVAEREFYKIPDSGFAEQVFVPGKKLVYRTIYSPLYLEDFITKNNIKAQAELERLTLNLLLFPLANKTASEMNEKYDKAVEILSKAAPNINHIDIRGGHALVKENGTSSDVENELNLLKNGLHAVVEAFANHNLTLHSVIMQIFLVFPEETFSSMNYSGKIIEIFNEHQSNITSFPNLTLIDQKAPNDVEIRLELSIASDFQTIRRMTKLEDGYSEDFTGASLFNSLDMGFVKDDLHFHK